MARAQPTLLEASLADAWIASLLAEGYCIIPDLMPTSSVEALWNDLNTRFGDTPFCEGEFYGGRTKRFGGLLKRSRHAADFIAHPLILEIAQAVLGDFCDRIQLNLSQALEIHPGQAVQPPHRDEDMWGGPKGEMEYLVNVMWPFTPYTRENGATVLYPGSHRDRRAYGAQEAIAAEMAPGSALLFLGSTLHGGGANRTFTPRTGMVISYCLGWLKPYENQWLVYPPDIACDFPRPLAKLVGYQQHRPNLGNYEGRCPSVLLDGPLPDVLGAIDELRPGQEAALAHWRTLQAI